MYSNENDAKAGLDTCGYAGKWASAKSYVSRHTSLDGNPYWEAVRTHFLELGGEYSSKPV